MTKGLSIGLVGLGEFGSHFAGLFKAHPLVSRIAFCDREPDRVRKFADDPFFRDKFHPRDAYASLEDICRSDLDALVIQTQPWLHAPQCLQALQAGKHVYSAVPIISIPDDAEILDWCDRLVAACRSTGLHYMLGETTFYHPETMFCRRQAAAGAFGDFVYAEGEYMHDVDGPCNLRVVQQYRTASQAGREWLAVRDRYRGRGALGGPMHYPTHSVSGPVSVMNAHALKVTAYGHRNRNQDPFFSDYAFSNEVALFQMSNGAPVRICEFREAAGVISKAEAFRVFGTRGAYVGHPVKAPEGRDLWYDNGRGGPASGKPAQVTRLTVAQMRDPLPPEVELAFKTVMHRDVDAGDLQRIEFRPTGHEGSHPYLVHEFVDAIAHRRRPAIHVWEAVRYMAMGVRAHQSALRDGETLAVPDWGDPPP